MARSTVEWRGKTDDQAIPPRVKIRVFDKAEGRCSHCTLLIHGSLLPAYDHIVALVNGGENRESNLTLLCVPCHKVKTKIDVAEKSQVYYKRKKAIGIRRKRKTIPGRRFNGEPRPSRWK